MKCSNLLLLALAALPSTALAQSGHSVNDHRLGDPLDEALAAGIHSVDVDVFYSSGGGLRVCTVLSECVPGKTLESVYLDPLLALGEERPSFFRIEIDVRVSTPVFYWQTVTGAYNAVAAAMAERPDLQGSVEITFFGNAQNYPPPSGNPSYLKFRADPNYYLPNAGWPYSWDGTGEMPEAEHDDLLARVEAAHNAGKLIMFAPHAIEALGDPEAVWDTLEAAGVDFITTLDPALYCEWAQGEPCS